MKTTPSPETRRCFLSSRTPPQPFCATFIIGLKRMQYDDERIFYGRIGRIGRVGRSAGAGGELGRRREQGVTGIRHGRYDPDDRR